MRSMVVFEMIAFVDAPPLANALTVLIILLALAAFIALWVYIFRRVWMSKGPNPPNFNDAIQYLTPILTALVGGIVALFFGVSLSHPHTAAHGTSPFVATILEIFSFEPSTWMFGTYAIAYLITGIASGFIWILRNDVTPSVVKNFSMTVIGLVVAIVSAAFGIKTP